MPSHCHHDCACACAKQQTVYVLETIEERKKRLKREQAKEMKRIKEDIVRIKAEMVRIRKAYEESVNKLEKRLEDTTNRLKE